MFFGEFGKVNAFTNILSRAPAEWCDVVCAWFESIKIRKRQVRIRRQKRFGRLIIIIMRSMYWKWIRGSRRTTIWQSTIRRRQLPTARLLRSRKLRCWTLPKPRLASTIEARILIFDQRRRAILNDKITGRYSIRGRRVLYGGALLSTSASVQCLPQTGSS